ncbi:MAG: ABC transporter ATP-binding protein, partial [Chloroflexi bacterium]|nr:ABC transporter ATP-binding protein [Chloroflexota bacterium]
IGPNGAGKTTLIRAISGLIPIQAGRVAADGRDLGQLSPSERARILAVVPQARNLPPYFTAWDTVMLGRTPHLNWLGQISPQDEERARQAMQRTDTYALAGRRVGELSGGEQQRLLLARALTQGAPILLLDEPTAHLDLKYQVTLLDLVRDLAHQDGLAVLMALHDLNLVRRCADQVALLVGGELQAMGTPEEVLEPELLSRAYHLPLVAIPMGSHGRSIIVPEERK